MGLTSQTSTGNVLRQSRISKLYLQLAGPLSCLQSNGFCKTNSNIYVTFYVTFHVFTAVTLKIYVFTDLDAVKFGKYL